MPNDAQLEPVDHNPFAHELEPVDHEPVWVDQMTHRAPQPSPSYWDSESGQQMNRIVDAYHWWHDTTISDKLRQHGIQVPDSVAAAEQHVRDFLNDPSVNDAMMMATTGGRLPKFSPEVFSQVKTLKKVASDAFMNDDMAAFHGANRKLQKLLDELNAPETAAKTIEEMPTGEAQKQLDQHVFEQQIRSRHLSNPSSLNAKAAEAGLPADKVRAMLYEQSASADEEITKLRNFLNSKDVASRPPESNVSSIVEPQKKPPAVSVPKPAPPEGARFNAKYGDLYTAESRQKMTEMVADGYKIPEIAAKFGVSKELMRYAINRHGIEVPRIRAARKTGE